MARRRSTRRRNRRRNKGPRQPSDDRQDKLFFEGEVEKSLPNTRFIVVCYNGMQVLAHLAGRLRRNRIRVTDGDRVSLEVSAYDPTRGRITYRHRKPQPSIV